MTVDVAITNEQLDIQCRSAALAEYQAELTRRVRNGSLPLDGALDGMRHLLNGGCNETISAAGHVIDTDAAPMRPSDDWEVVWHRPGGKIDLAKDGIGLYLISGQKQGREVDIFGLYPDVARQANLNACVLDYLLANRRLIPERWIGRHVFFWDTIYRDPQGYLCVRALCGGTRETPFRWGFVRLYHRFNRYEPAAVRVSF